MRFLHLADLHLGKSIYGVSLIDSGDQKVWVDRLLEKARELRPDAAVIAGDVYDRGLPPGKAAQLLSRLVTGLCGLEIPVMITAGNHDSIQHLSFLSPLLEKQKVYISRPLENSPELVRAVLPDPWGDVTFWLMPYVFPALAAQAAGEEIRDYDTAVRKILAAQQVDFSRRNVLIAHQNVTAGGREAERGGSESMVGGVGQVDYTAFDGFDYVALGHIHSAYTVGRESVRYAGTPMAYHFNEVRQPKKGPLLVTLPEKGGKIEIELVEIPPLHPLREIRGTWDQVRAGASEKKAEQSYLKVVLTDTGITPEIADYLRQAARAQGGEVLELTSEFSAFAGEASAASARDIEERPVETLFADFYRDRNQGVEAGPEDLELMTFVGELTRAAQGEPEEKDFQKIVDFVMRQEGKIS